MRVGYKKLGTVLGTVAVLGLVFGSPLAAQAEDFGPDREGFIRYSDIFWSLDARGGVSLPVGDLGDVADPGAAIGAGLAYFLNPNFALRLDGNLDLWSGLDETGANADSEAPDILRFGYFGGFEVHVTDPAADGAQFSLNLGAGGVTFNSDKFSVTDATIIDDDGTSQTVQRATGAFQDTYFALKGGARLGVNLSEVVNLFLSGEAHWMFLDEQDTSLLAQFYDQEPFDSGLAIPIQGGLRINVP